VAYVQVQLNTDDVVRPFTQLCHSVCLPTQW